MTYKYKHSNVYIVRIVDVNDQGEVRTWHTGPYGSTRAERTADYLESAARDAGTLRQRECFVEPLWSNDECLRVADYDRATQGSLY